MTLSSSHPSNPFTRSTFWGRESELQTIRRRLLSNSPQSIAIVGELFIGKTELVRHFVDTPHEPITYKLEKRQAYTFVYLDCQPYQPYTQLPEMGDYAAAKFWWDLNAALRQRLQLHEALSFPEPKANMERGVLIDSANEIKTHIEEQIRGQSFIIFVLDNFEVVARMPRYNSEWLRSLAAYNCAYMVTSRYLLYLLYQHDPQNLFEPSPLWNIFSDPIYLGLMSENEVQHYLKQASEQSKSLGSYWKPDDIPFVKHIAGRHPELLRIACSRLFEHRLPVNQSSEAEYDDLTDEFLEYQIYKDANVVCSQLWYGLINPELDDKPRNPDQLQIRDVIVAPYQRALIEIAGGRVPADTEVLFVLRQRGLIERVGGEWRVFAEAMRQFVLKQRGREHTLLHDGQPVIPVRAHIPGERREDFSLTYLEGKVYEYLKTHAGEVCDREDIKRVVWGESEISNSALQKIIERLRDKIAEDSENAYELLAVRGRGYMLRRR